MTTEKFCYWLQGFFQITEPSSLNESQIKTIQNELAKVFWSFDAAPTDPPSIPLKEPLLDRKSRWDAARKRAVQNRRLKQKDCDQNEPLN